MGLEYILRTSIYKIQDDRNSELADVAEQGKVVLYGVTVGADEICEIAKETIIPYVKKQKGVMDGDRKNT